MNESPILYNENLIADYSSFADIIEDCGYDTGFIKKNLYGMTTRKYNEKYDLSEFLQWGRRNPSRFGEEVFNVQFLDYQRYLIDSSWSKPFVVWAMSRNGGKALALDTPILKPDGSYTTMGELNIGDYVVGDDGQPTKIISASPIFEGHKCYEIIFDDGEVIVADEDHIWSVYDKHGRNKDLKDVLTKDIAKKYVRYRANNGYPEYKYAVPLCAPVYYPEKELPITPYLLGVWLGDGFKYSGKISSGKDDYEELCKILESHGCFVFSIRNDSNGNKIINMCDKGNIPLTSLINKNNLYKSKHIPDEYLISSIEQRLELIRGLMDTDGYCDGKNCYFYNTNINIINGFTTILNSLGVKNVTTTKKTKCNGKIFNSYVVTFAGSKQMPFFYIRQKKDRLRDTLINRRTYKTIVSVKEVPSVKTKCIFVDNKSHRYLCGNKNTVTHNTICASLFTMSKMLLIPNFKAYILAAVGSQSIEMFLKMEAFALKNISSFTNLNDVFQSNVVKGQNSNGWGHDPASHRVSTYGGAQCFTLNGNFNNNRSKRSSLNIYDEAMNSPDELFATSEPFTTQNAEFKAGKDYNAEDLLSEPKPFPNQLLYCSSAGRTDQYFFKKYKEFSMKMFAGDRRYFVADISSDVIIGATVHNKLWPVPLLTQEKVDQAMRVDKEAALREYSNIFTNEGGDGQIIKRATIIRNSVPRLPILSNKDGTHKFALLYDSARSKDNSVVLIAEYINDPDVGWKMRIGNVVNLINRMKKNKTPMTTPNQIKEVKKLLLDYNGTGVADYENILGFWIDAGSGGAGVNISDFFWEDWEDEQGVMHRGLIDKEYSPEESRLYPNAIKDKMRLIQPTKYKVEMFRSLIEMMDMNLIEWPNEYDNRGYIMLMYDVNERTGEKTIRYKEPTESEVKSLSKKGISVIREKYDLSTEEEEALKQIDLMKTELVNIYRYKQASGGDRFDLSPDMSKKINDDRAYVAAMAAFLLQQLRRERLVRKSNDRKSSIIDMLTVVPGRGLNKIL